MDSKEQKPCELLAPNSRKKTGNIMAGTFAAKTNPNFLADIYIYIYIRNRALISHPLLFSKPSSDITSTSNPWPPSPAPPTVVPSTLLSHLPRSESSLRMVASTARSISLYSVLKSCRKKPSCLREPLLFLPATISPGISDFS